MIQLPKRPTLPPPPSRQQSSSAISFEKIGDSTGGSAAVIYGTGGIGKTTLACQAPGPVGFVDADNSLEKLKPRLIEAGIPIPVRISSRDWLTLRSDAQKSGYDSIKTVVYDSWQIIELWARAHVLATVRTDKNGKASAIEDYGFGKGYSYIYDSLLLFLGDLDRHRRAGRNVILIAHDDTAKVPNPGGTDFIRWEPKMQNVNNGNIRYFIKGWADHVLFVQYDINAVKAEREKHGKAEGHGSRTLYSEERPHFMAKSRSTAESFDVTLGGFDWSRIII